VVSDALERTALYLGPKEPLRANRTHCPLGFSPVTYFVELRYARQHSLLTHELPICYTPLLTVTPFLLGLAMGLMAVSPDLSMAAASEQGCLSSGRSDKCCGLLTVSSVNSVPEPASLMLLGGQVWPVLESRGGCAPTA